MPLQNGQTTLDGSRPLPSRPADVVSQDEGTAENGQLSPDEMGDDHDADVATKHRSISSNDFVFEHYEPNDNTRRDEAGDVEMG